MTTLRFRPGMPTGIVLVLAGLAATGRTEPASSEPPAATYPRAEALLMRLYPDGKAGGALRAQASSPAVGVRPAMPAVLPSRSGDAATSPPATAVLRDPRPIPPMADAPPVAVEWPPVSLNWPPASSPLAQPTAPAITPSAAASWSVTTMPSAKRADAGTGAPRRAQALAPQAVAVNRADAGELERKLNIDARRARFIIEFRRAYGPFKRPEDLTQVYGITDAMLALWEQGDRLVLE